MQKINSLLAQVLVFALCLSMFVPVVSSQKRQKVRIETLKGIVEKMIVEENEVEPTHSRFFIVETDGKNRMFTYLSGKVDFEPLFNKEVVLRGVRSGYLPVMNEFGSVEKIHSPNFEVTGIEKVIEDNSLNAPGSVFGPLTLPPPSHGQERPMLTINIAPANNPTPQYSVEWLRGKLHTNLDSLGNLIRENSYDQYKLVGFHHPLGDVAPWVTVSLTPVPAPNGTCYDYFNAALVQADNMLEAQGFSKTAYRTRQYLFRNMPECAGLAQATLGPFGETSGVRYIFIHLNSIFGESSSNIMNQQTFNTMLHELGHNLGQGAHSRGENSENGQIWEYGDKADPMGTVQNRYMMFGNIIRMKLGWHASTARYEVIDTRGSHSRYIQTPAIATKGRGPNGPPIGYIIPILNSDGTLTGDVYFVERRIGHGLFDQFASQTVELGKGLIVRRHSTNFVSPNSGSIMMNFHPTMACCNKAAIPFGTTAVTQRNVSFSVGYGTRDWLYVTFTLPDNYPASIQEAELIYQKYHRDKAAK
jgi:hypothetical protein